MASSKHQASDDKGKLRLRFMEVEIEGSNETLLESIRQITAATGTKTVVREVGRAASARALPAPAVSDESGLPADGADVGPGDELDDETATTASAAPKRVRRPRVSKAPALSTTLRLADEPNPLKEFCETTKITAKSSIIDKAVVVATWLRDHRQLTQMTAGDLFTCCKFMDWDPPLDTTAPMRHLKREKQMTSSGRGKFSLSLLGDKHFKELRK